MEFTTIEATIYEYYWGKRLCGFALTREAAVRAVENHYLYGEPENAETDLFLGTKWAEDSNTDGWRIEAKLLTVTKLPGKLKGSFAKEETSHLIWRCPECGQDYSDDVTKNDISPELVCCSCKKYYLIEF